MSGVLVQDCEDNSGRLCVHIAPSLLGNRRGDTEAGKVMRIRADRLRSNEYGDDRPLGASRPGSACSSMGRSDSYGRGYSMGRSASVPHQAEETTWILHNASDANATRQKNIRSRPSRPAVPARRSRPGVPDLIPPFKVNAGISKDGFRRKANGGVYAGAHNGASQDRTLD